MLLAIVADTHMPRGRRAIPPRCRELMLTSDLILHAGDLVSEEVLREIEAIGPPVEAVRGNMDSAALQRLLPNRTIIEVEGGRIAMVHDGGPSSGRLARLRRAFPDADAAVFGHSHLPVHERDGDFQIFNPGSPTERRRAPHHTMGLTHVSGKSIEFELVVLD
jgi:putative phosphoesterase